MAGAASEKERLARIRRNQEDIVSRLRAGDLVKIYRNGGFFKHWAVYIGDSLVIHVQVPNEDGAFFRTSMSVSGVRETSTRNEGDTYSPRYTEVTGTSTYSHHHPNDHVAHIYPSLHVPSNYPIGAVSMQGYSRKRTQLADRPSSGSILRKKDSYVLIENIFDVAQNDEIELGNDLDIHKMPLPPDKIVARAESLLGIIEYHALYKNCEHFARWCRYGEEISVQSRQIVAGLTLGPMIGGFLIGGPVGATVAGILSVGALIKNAWNEKPN